MRPHLNVNVTLLLAVFFCIVLPSCGRMVGNTNRGELRGYNNKKQRWKEAKPYGMVKINRSSFNMGMNDEDPFKSLNSETKTVSIEPFWMDETEITNNEYRQFVQWVIDSTARKKLSEYDDRYLIKEDIEGNIIDQPILNWDEKIDYSDPEVENALEEMYYPSHERFDNHKKIDVRKLKYEWSEVDLLQAAYVKYDNEAGEYDGFIYDNKGEYRKVEDRSDFIVSDGTYIYPDTLVWMRDFTYAYNEPMTRNYLSHPSYIDYPVVGVSWKQAVAFCKWRTSFLKNYIAKNKRRNNVYKVLEFRLPTEAEWEMAARGGVSSGIYPWGGPYTRSLKGCFLANFKPLRGNYGADGFTYTAPVGSYKPNNYGLYDMAGNVAEWTLSPYNTASYNVVHDLNPTYEYNTRPDEGDLKKKRVVRGGSWKDVKPFLQVGARSYEFEDKTSSYIGFRCVKAYLGTN